MVDQAKRIPLAQSTDIPSGDLNVAALSGYFEKAGFPVKVAEKAKSGNMFRFEYNHPTSALRTISMRKALLKFGAAEVSTYYQYNEISEKDGALSSRERALIPFENDSDLRAFFNSVLNFFAVIADESKVIEEEHALSNGGSSYRPDQRTRRAVI